MARAGNERDTPKLRMHRDTGRVEWGLMPNATRPLANEQGLSPGGDDLRRTEDEWLGGWDPTPGIVSVWAESDGRASVWRRLAETGELVREEARFRP